MQSYMHLTWLGLLPQYYISITALRTPNLHFEIEWSPDYYTRLGRAGMAILYFNINPPNYPGKLMRGAHFSYFMLVPDKFQLQWIGVESALHSFHL